MTIALDHSVFDTAVGDVREVAAQLEQTRTDAARRVDSFLRDGWSGLAAEAFAEAWTDWAAAAGDVRAGLADIAELLDATHADLTARDHDSADGLGVVAARLRDRLG